MPVNNIIQEDTMDQQIRESARKIVDAIIAKEMKVYFEGESAKPKREEDLNAVTIVLRSGKKIRIQATGHARRPENTKLEGVEFKFFQDLQLNPTLAGEIRKMLLTAKFTKRDTARTAAEYAEML
jgi:hypothetical protein